MVDVRPYRPSNGTEGDSFIGRWCDRCALCVNEEDEGCSILEATQFYDDDDEHYPEEWIEDESGPRCTAFVPEGEPAPTPRCEHTSDMFGETAP